MHNDIYCMSPLSRLDTGRGDIRIMCQASSERDTMSPSSRVDRTLGRSHALGVVDSFVSSELTRDVTPKI